MIACMHYFEVNTKADMCIIYVPQTYHKTSFVNVDKQKNGSDCGLTHWHSVQFSVLGMSHKISVMFSKTDMQKCLLQGLTQNKMEPFLLRR